MSTWDDVVLLCERLPDARLGEAHEGSPAWYAGRHPFARWRRFEDLAGGRELVQVWSGDLTLGAALADRPDTWPVVHTFRHRISAWGVLIGLGRRELAELLLDSYRVRGGTRRAAAVDESAYFAGL